jgi:hypothetical protein
MSRHNSMAIIISAALGGSSGEKRPPRVGDPGVRDLAEGHGDIHSAVAAINMALRGGG